MMYITQTYFKMKLSIMNNLLILFKNKSYKKKFIFRSPEIIHIEHQQYAIKTLGSSAGSPILILKYEALLILQFNG